PPEPAGAEGRPRRVLDGAVNGASLPLVCTCRVIVPFDPPEIKAHTPAPRTPRRQASGQASAAASSMAWHPKPTAVVVTGAGKPGFPARPAARPTDPPSPHQRRARQAATAS